MQQKNKDPKEPGIAPLQMLVRHYKVSSRELARQCGTSPSKMADIVERGTMPDLETAFRLSRYFRKRAGSRYPMENSIEIIWGKFVDGGGSKR